MSISRKESDNLSSMEKQSLSTDENHSKSQLGGQLNEVPEEGLYMSDSEKALHRRVNRKMDIFLLPVMSLLYLMNGLDRSNIGAAGTSTFAKDVGMAPTAINNAVTLFFITFIIFQPFSAALGKRLGFKVWIPILMVCWGIFTLAHAWTRSEGMLIALRLLIGAAEAGFYSTACLSLASWYCRYDLAFRIAIFYGSYACAGAFSGVLAFGLLQINANGMHGWQYLFIVEGALTIGLAIFGFFWLPADIGTAWFLNADERAWAVERMIRDSGGRDNRSSSITKLDVTEALKDWKFWMVLPCNIAASVPNQAFSVFLPIIVKALGYSSYRANLFSVPIYFIGAVGLIAITYASDRRRTRGYFILFSLVFVFVGLIMVSEIKSASGRYAALCILQIGAYSAPPLTVAWLANNTPEPGKRAIVLGMNGWGNAAGVIGAQLFRPQHAPRYRLPFLVSLGINIFSICGYAFYLFFLKFVNSRRDRATGEWTDEQRKAELDDSIRLGDNKLTFRG